MSTAADKNSRNINMPELSGRTVTVLLAALVTFTVLAVYWPAAGHDYLNVDDYRYVVDNRMVQEGLTVSSMADAFRPFSGEYWSPLLWLSFMLDAELYGPGPAGFHTTNVILHALNAAMLLIFLTIATGRNWLAFITALLFALHPLRVESVAWIVQRKDVLSAFFFLAALLAYLFYTRGRRLLFIPAWLLVAAGLMVKPILVTAPLLFLFLDHWPLKRLDLSIRPVKMWLSRNSSVLLEKAAMLPLTIIFGLLTLSIQGESLHAITHPLSLVGRVMRPLAAYGKYLLQTVWPMNLSFQLDYQRGVEDLHLDTGTLSLAVILAITWWVIRRREDKPFLIAGWLWYLAALFPVSGFIAVGSQWSSDRFTYLPHMLLLAAAVWLAGDLFSGKQARKAATASALVLLIALGAVTSSQLRYWSDSRALFSRSLDMEPGNANTLAMLGRAHYLEKEFEEGERYLASAVALEPDDFYFRRSLASLLAERGSLHQAMEHYFACLELDGEEEFHFIHNEIGTIFLDMGSPYEAIEHLSKAVQLEPGFHDAHFNAALAYSAAGNLEAAILHLKKAAELAPSDMEILFNLAETLAGTGRRDDAVDAFRRISSTVPGTAGSYYAEGRIEEMYGNRLTALSHYRDGLAAPGQNPGIAKALELAINRVSGSQ
jgi:tetratricopeptide (TPR) repeat protein